MVNPPAASIALRTADTGCNTSSCCAEVLLVMREATSLGQAEALMIMTKFSQQNLVSSMRPAAHGAMALVALVMARDPERRSRNT